MRSGGSGRPVRAQVLAQQQPAAGPATTPGVVSTYRPDGEAVSLQDGFAAMQQSAALTPRDAAGHPDSSGNWVANFPNPIGAPGLRGKRGRSKFDQAVMQRGAQWNKPLYKLILGKGEEPRFQQSDVDPAYGCTHPTGVPRQNAPAIVQSNNQIWLFNGVENALRILPIDENDPPDAEHSTYNGMGLARWDGDTLVIESVGFNDITWLAGRDINTDRMKVTERFRRQGDLLFPYYTVDDPDVLMEPDVDHGRVRAEFKSRAAGRSADLRGARYRSAGGSVQPRLNPSQGLRPFDIALYGRASPLAGGSACLARAPRAWTLFLSWLEPYGAPVPDDPRKSLRPSGNVRSRPFARRVPSLRGSRRSRSRCPQ